MLRSFSLILIAVFLFPSFAPAETIWSYYPLGFQTERHEIITSCEISLCFYYDYDSHNANGTCSPEILRETVTASSQGMMFTATAETDPNFSDFVGRVLKKDNQTDLIFIRLITNNGTDLSTGTIKSVVFSGCPDLSSQTITSVSLTLNDFTLDTPGNDIWHDGKDTYLNEALTLSINVPEPNSMMLFVTAVSGSGGFWILRRKKAAACKG